MPMLKINIETTNAAIQIQTTPAKLKIANPKPEINLQTQQTKLQMSSELPKVEIDQRQAFAETGLSNPLNNAREFYKSALSNGVRAIGNIVSEGMEFLRIEKKGNPIASQAKQVTGINDSKSISMRAAPTSGAQITLRPGSLNIEFNGGQVSGNFKPSEPKVDYTPYDVSINIVPPPTIEITVDEVTSGFVPQVAGGGQSVNTQL